MIKNVLLDFGGVVVTLDKPQAISRFEEIGLKHAAEHLDAYTQTGIFGDLERGDITDETFRIELGKLIGHEVTWDECRYAWLGYVGDVPQRNLDYLLKLRSMGYRVILVSNTNPYMMSWALSTDFDGKGHTLEHYLDACYTSYQIGALKPDDQFFHRVIRSEHIMPNESIFVDDGPRNVAAASEMGLITYCPENGSDWTVEVEKRLQQELSC